MEERLLIVLTVLGLGRACVAVWPRVDEGLDWLAGHLGAAPAVMCGAGLAVCLPAFVAGALPIALSGAALTTSGAVVYGVCHQADLGSRHDASNRRPTR